MDMGLLSCEDLGEIPQWDEHKVDYGSAIIYKTGLLKKAYTNFLNQKAAWEIHHTETMDIETIVSEFSAFCRKQRAWLDDYALFMTLKDLNNGNVCVSVASGISFSYPENAPYPFKGHGNGNWLL